MAVSGGSAEATDGGDIDVIDVSVKSFSNPEHPTQYLDITSCQDYRRPVLAFFSHYVLILIKVFKRQSISDEQ